MMSTGLIDKATRAHQRLFGTYMVLVLLGCIFTYLVWSSGNRVQDAVKSDADARIGEANQKAAEATASAATIEQSNLSLRSQLATLERQANDSSQRVAVLQRQAADAQNNQQRTEIELAKQKEQTAIAERSLLELQTKLKPRTLTTDQRARLIAGLAILPKGPVGVVCVLGDAEGLAYASEIDAALNAAGWKTGGVTQAVYSGGNGNPRGIILSVHSRTDTPVFATLFADVFYRLGLVSFGQENPEVGGDFVQVLVGNKP